MQQGLIKFKQKIYFLGIFLQLFPISAFAETSHGTVHKENGEEVYESKSSKPPVMKKKEEPAKKTEATHENKDAHNSPPEKKAEASHDAPNSPPEKKAEPNHANKEEHAAENSHNTTTNAKDSHTSDMSKAAETEHKSTSLSDKYKSNKLVTLEEEDPYEVRKPMGIFWFAGVFLTLLIVIFIFT